MAKIISLILAFMLLFPIVLGASSTTWTEFEVEETLEMTILSPKAATYCSTSIPIKIQTNLESTCYYKLDSGNWINMGQGNYFSKNIRVSEGTHTLYFKCHSGNQYSEDSVTFKVDIKESDKKEIIESLPVICQNINNCTAWTCKNGIMTRVCQFNTCQDSVIQHGDVCGIEKTEETIKSDKGYYNLILILAILILFVIILLVYALKR